MRSAAAAASGSRTPIAALPRNSLPESPTTGAQGRRQGLRGWHGDPHEAGGLIFRADDVIEVAVMFNRNIDLEGDLHLNIEVGPNDVDGGLQTAAYAARAPIP